MPFVSFPPIYASHPADLLTNMRKWMSKVLMLLELSQTGNIHSSSSCPKLPPSLWGILRLLQGSPFPVGDLNWNSPYARPVTPLALEI